MYLLHNHYILQLLIEGCLMQVLDDNVYEMRMRSHESAGPSTAALMDVDTQCPSRQVTLSR